MRIVSLCPSLTELVFDLGRGADLVGVTRWCVHPAQGVAAIEKVGGTKNPDVARIVALGTDLVLINREENRLEDSDALAAAGIDCHASMPRTIAETAAMVRSIGVALDRSERAETIAADIEARARRVQEVAAGEPGVRFAYLIWRNPWMAVNGDTFAHALLSLAGGINVFAERTERYPEIRPEELAGVSPAAVFLCTEPFPFRESHAEELGRLTGLSADRIRIVDGEYLSWHGSRTPDGIDYADRLMKAARNASQWPGPA